MKRERKKEEKKKRSKKKMKFRLFPLLFFTELVLFCVPFFLIAGAGGGIALYVVIYARYT